MIVSSFFNVAFGISVLTDVESTSSENTGHSRQHTGFVLNETVERVPIEWYH
jgi:hypothetical protein